MDTSNSRRIASGAGRIDREANRDLYIKTLEDRHRSYKNISSVDTPKTQTVTPCYSCPSWLSGRK